MHAIVVLPNTNTLSDMNAWTESSTATAHRAPVVAIASRRDSIYVPDSIYVSIISAPLRSTGPTKGRTIAYMPRGVAEFARTALLRSRSRGRALRLRPSDAGARSFAHIVFGNA